jgi:hypothetical protein
VLAGIRGVQSLPPGLTVGLDKILGLTGLEQNPRRRAEPD